MKRVSSGRVAVRRRAGWVVEQLKTLYPEVACELEFSNPLELLVAVILSAQTTDKQVNRVTPGLFREFPTVEDYAERPVEDLEQAIRQIGFWRAKAANIRRMCQLLIERHDGQVPSEIDALVALPGVGRKTANVVLGVAFGIASGVVVDTHVKRIAFRLGLTTHENPVKIEQDLNALVPQEEWIDLTHRMIRFGRAICRAPRPKCQECLLEPRCPQQGVSPA